MKPDITVALPTYNRGELLVDTIKEVLSQTHKNLELLVIDQTKELDKNVSKKISDMKDPRMRYILTDPPSLPAARNFALNNASAPIVLYIDDDVKLKPDLVKNHLLAFKLHPDAVAIGGRVLQKDFPVKKKVLVFDEFAVSHGVFTASESGYTNAFPGGNHSIIVNVALSVGGYDTRYRGNAFREESDMSMKLIRSGKKIYYDSSAELLHLAAHSGGLESRKKGHIYDSRTFYPNELFFTLRSVKPGIKIAALKVKYNEYCSVPSRKTTLKRTILFFLGLATAIWRMAFGRKIVTKERHI